MKLINTDGLAFIGPGSEWFWTALQFIALALTFVALYRQLRGQQEQIKDETKVLRSQSHYNALVLAQRPWELMVENERLARIVTAGLANPEGLSEVDWMRCSSYMFMQFNGWEYFYYQNKEGAIPKELWSGADATFKGLIATQPGYARFWSESQASFDEPFRSYASQEFAKRPSVVPQA